MSQESWKRSQRWLQSPECHGLCCILASISDTFPAKKALADKVASFLWPSALIMAKGIGSACILDAITMEQVAVFTRCSRNASPHSVASDGENLYMISAKGEAVIMLADMKIARLSQPFPSDGERVSCLTLSPDGQNLVTGHLNGCLSLWNVGSCSDPQFMSSVMKLQCKAQARIGHESRQGHEHSFLGAPLGCTYAPSGRCVAVGSGMYPNMRLHIVDSESLSVLQSCRVDGNCVAFNSLAFGCDPSMNENCLAVCCQTLNNLFNDDFVDDPRSCTCMFFAADSLIKMKDLADVRCVTLVPTLGVFAAGDCHGHVHLLDTSSLHTLKTLTLQVPPEMHVSSLFLAGITKYLIRSIAPTCSGSMLAVTAEFVPRIKSVTAIYLVDTWDLHVRSQIVLGFECTEIAFFSMGRQHAPFQGSNSTRDWTQSEVIQAITHTDVAANRDVDAAQLQVDVEWADRIASQICDDRSSPRSVSGSACAHNQTHLDPSNIYMHRYGSAPTHRGRADDQHFREVLLTGPQLKPCREALYRSGHDCVLPAGALFFVRPDQVEDVMKALKGHTIHPYHVIVDESFEYLIEEILAAIPFKKRPKRKPGDSGRAQLAKAGAMGGGYAASHVDSAFDSKGIFIVKRTFICATPLQKEATSVTQSTTEAIWSESKSHYCKYRGANPRRHV